MEILLRWNWRLRYRNSFNRNIFGYVIIHDKDESVRLSVIILHVLENRANDSLAQLAEQLTLNQ